MTLRPNHPSVSGNLGIFRTYQYDEQSCIRSIGYDGRMKSTYGFDYQFVHADSSSNFQGILMSKTKFGAVTTTKRQNHPACLGGAVPGSPRMQENASRLSSEPVVEPVEDHSFRLSYSVAHTIPTFETFRH